MAYFLNLFSPETYEAFRNSSMNVSGFRVRQKVAALRLHPGDLFVCYVTKLSRWCGLLKIVDGPYEDDSPIFYAVDDPFVVRFHVEPLVWLVPEQTIPIRDARIWSHLSFTKDFDPRTSQWTGKLRSSLTQISDKDGQFLASLLARQQEQPEKFPVNEQEYAKLTTHTVKRSDKVVNVSIPSNTEQELADQSSTIEPVEIRESIRIQALLADIGAKMGLKIWLPRSDRGRVEAEQKVKEARSIELLPLSYDETTLRTIEQIDVLWLRGRAIVRAFEVEHTTSIYSGILRMADLLALQPNMDIKLHIVAPETRREKVMQEIRRPVFSLLEKGPLYESCTFLSYDSVRELAMLKHLSHLSDSVLEEYIEEAE